MIESHLRRCNSNAFTEETRFDILLLDESSQIIEPASIFPLTCFGSRRFLALGDPKVLFISDTDIRRVRF